MRCSASAPARSPRSLLCHSDQRVQELGREPAGGVRGDPGAEGSTSGNGPPHVTLPRSDCALFQQMVSGTERSPGFANSIPRGRPALGASETSLRLRPERPSHLLLTPKWPGQSGFTRAGRFRCRPRRPRWGWRRSRARSPSAAAMSSWAQPNKRGRTMCPALPGDSHSRLSVAPPDTAINSATTPIGTARYRPNPLTPLRLSVRVIKAGQITRRVCSPHDHAHPGDERRLLLQVRCGQCIQVLFGPRRDPSAASDAA